VESPFYPSTWRSAPPPSSGPPARHSIGHPSHRLPVSPARRSEAAHGDGPEQRGSTTQQSGRSPPLPEMRAGHNYDTRRARPLRPLKVSFQSWFFAIWLCFTPRWRRNLETLTNGYACGVGLCVAPPSGFSGTLLAMASGNR
jgi:hypothetical protein